MLLRTPGEAAMHTAGIASTGSRFIVSHDTHTTRCAGRDLRGGWLAG